MTELSANFASVLRAQLREAEKHLQSEVRKVMTLAEAEVKGLQEEEARTAARALSAYTEIVNANNAIGRGVDGSVTVPTNGTTEGTVDTFMGGTDDAVDATDNAANGSESLALDTGCENNREGRGRCSITRAEVC